MNELAPLVGLEVTQVWVWGELRLLFESGEPEIPDASVDVSTFRFIDADGAAHDVDVGADPVSAGCVLGVLRHRVMSASADDWTLRLTFENGAQLVCPPDPRYEAWAANVPGGTASIICLPGAGVE